MKMKNKAALLRKYVWYYRNTIEKLIGTGTGSVGDPGCFIPDPRIFSPRIQDLGSYVLCKKGVAKPNFFLASYGFRSKF
jgi:hypothetical protein